MKARRGSTLILLWLLAWPRVDMTYSTHFTVVGLASSSEEAAQIASMAGKEVLDVEVILDTKSREIADLKQMVVHLCREVEHHQNMSDFYQGEVKRIKELLAFVRRKLARVSRAINLKK
ncbi:hypothetical protein AMTR_s00070p00065290 [Amborella trichopoda]|uniref:Uncharacterized protein n=1 Tax=Amborella trichopoda TaxID=13333 RepID=U5D4S0_AMBTC|nr:hypothetical protein AMTR_s00070p00065290 [Amborella trichopoda]